MRNCYLCRDCEYGHNHHLTLTFALSRGNVGARWRGVEEQYAHKPEVVSVFTIHAWQTIVLNFLHRYYLCEKGNIGVI